MNSGQTTEAQRKASGFNQQTLDAGAKQGFANAAFEVDEEEIPDIVEEHYSDDPSPTASDGEHQEKPPTTNRIWRQSYNARP